MRSRLCSRAVSNGRSEWVQACWQNNVQGIRAIAGFCYLHGHCLVGHAMAEIEQSTAGLVAVDAFELEVLLTWARELRLEYEVGS